jgi:hypothetical protein
MAEYRQRPEAKAKRKALVSTPEFKAAYRERVRKRRAQRNTMEKLGAKLAALDNTLKGPTSSNHLLMTEIRTTLANMPREERRKHILANVGDKEVMAAVLRCPAFLAALSPEEQQDFRQQWAVKAMPEELAHRNELARALDHVERAGKLLVGYQVSLYSGHLIRAAEETSAKVAAATAAARAGAMH